MLVNLWAFHMHILRPLNAGYKLGRILVFAPRIRLGHTFGWAIDLWTPRTGEWAESETLRGGEP